MKYGIWRALWILIVSCAEGRHAGSTSVTTNGTVSGVIKDSAGIVLAGVDTTWLQQTDERGFYQFSQVIPGEYRVLVRNVEKELGGLSEGLHVDSAGETEAVVELDTLLRWRVSLQPIAAQWHPFGVEWEVIRLLCKILRLCEWRWRMIFRG